MEKKIIYSTLLLSTAIIGFSSYKTGPAHGGLGNRTGSSGSSNSCSMGCHGAESSALLLSISLTDITTGEVIADGQYEPGHEYMVKLSGSYSGSASYTHLGFQASVVNAVGANSGVITAVSSNTGIVTVGGLTLIEHISPIPKTEASYEASFQWTAPLAGSGSADFYARMVVNNNNSMSSDDTPNKIQATFTEKSITSIKTPDINYAIKLYPNPCDKVLNIAIADAVATDYRFVVRDMNAREIFSYAYRNNDEKLNYKLDIGNLMPGMYFIEINTGNKREVRRFLKQ